MAPSHLKTALILCSALALSASACSSDSASSTSSATASSVASSTSSTTTTEPASSSTVPSPEETVTVFFSVGDGSDCSEVAGFERPLPADSPPVEAALLGLVAGPSDEEQAEGASSFFSAATADIIRGVDDRGDVLVVDFNDLRTLIPNASTSCGSAALLAQLNETTLQFAPRVRYEIEGSCDVFFNWLQGECQEATSDGMEPADLTTNERASGSGCTPAGDLTDGEWFGFPSAVEATTVEFDLACWFSGTAAIDASAEDGEESPPPNDYYIRNENETLRTLTLDSSTMVVWLASTGDPGSATEGDVDGWLEIRDGREHQPGVWLTIEDGSVVRIEEQFVP